MKRPARRRHTNWRPADLERLEPRITPSVGTLRIAEYNITSSGGTPRSGLDTILQAMGQESVGGRVQPLDVFLMQEVQSGATTGQTVVNLLNSLYGAGTYSRGSLDGTSTGSGTQGIVFNSHTVQLVSESVIGTSSTSGQPRQALRYKLHPIGFSSAADFYVYNSHYKSADDATSKQRRLDEAISIRADADALGQGAQIIYVGDFNTYTSTEPGYQKLLSAGAGQAVDPINQPGSWHNNATFVGIMTQAPANSPPSGLTGGGLDDRFDFQLFTSELQDGQGLEYASGSYHTFGNNGSVPLNGDINSSSSTALAGLANRTTVLNLLTTVSDHLPVLADYVVTEPFPSVQFTAAAQSSAEGSGTFTIAAQLSEATLHDVIVPFVLGGTATAGLDFTIPPGPLTIFAGSTTASITIPVTNDLATEVDETIIVTMSTPTGASLGSTFVHTATILDDDSYLQATSVTLTTSGVDLTFNRPIDTGTLNLHSIGPADLTLVGATRGRIAGSLVISASGSAATFIATGGPLAADSYTLTLRSAADGFRDLSGHLLDGDANGSDGGDLVRVFNIAASSAVVVRLPDFARGAGQAINVPATSTSGIPITLSSGTGITSVDVFIDYDPSLIQFTGATLAPGRPGSVSFDSASTPGRAHLTYTSATQAGTGALTLVNLQADVRDSAPYSAKQALKLSSLLLNGGAIASIAGHAVHVASYLGDTSGNGDYSAFDAALIDRVSVGLDEGFAAYLLADPSIVGDASGNGSVSSFDSSLVRRAAVGFVVPQLPALPDDGPASLGGLDPKLSIGRGYVVASGEKIAIPIDLEQTDTQPIGFGAADVLIRFDTSKFRLIGVSPGSLTISGLFDWKVDEGSGTVFLSIAAENTRRMLPGERGTLAVIELEARTGAMPGRSAVNLLASSRFGAARVATRLNEGRLILVPAPTNAANDATDGMISITGDTSPIFTRNPRANFAILNGPVFIALPQTVVLQHPMLFFSLLKRSSSTRSKNISAQISTN